MNNFEKSLLNFYNESQLKKIQNINIAIAGAGGLGSNIAMTLVRSGFKNFEIVDKDNIEYSNLNRQYYFYDEVGQSKVNTLKKSMLRINPDLKIKIHHEIVNPGNILNFFQNSDFLFEAFDSIESKILLFETFGNQNKTIIMGNGMTGFSNKNEIKINKISNKHYIVGDNKTDINKGDKPFTPRVITCAALMSSIALEIILSE